MEREKPVARAVIMNHKVVDAQNIFVTEDLFLDFLYLIRVRCGTEDRAQGILYKHYAAVEDEYSNKAAHNAVDDRQVCKVDNYSCDKHSACGDAVISGVGCSGQKSLRIYALADIGVKNAEPKFKTDGCNKNSNAQPAELNSCWVEYLVDA